MSNSALDEKKVEIVSLGVNCLPRTLLTRRGIKPRKADGELSCPFDLVKHTDKMILTCLQNGFENYFDDFFFVEKKWLFSFLKKKGLWQKTDGTKFFHDKDCGKDDFEKLKTRIENRIKNFNQIVVSDKPVLFVMSLTYETEYIDEIYEALKVLRANKQFEFAVISFGARLNIRNTNIKYLHLPLPTKDYIKYWNRKKFVKSDLGEFVEVTIANFIQLIIDKMK